MEIAGERVSRCIRQFFPQSGSVVVFCGKGHNGGDALVAAQHLKAAGWRIFVRLSSPLGELAPLTRRHLEDLESDRLESLAGIEGKPLIVIDGLLGIGVRGAPHGVIAERIRELNGLRNSGAFTVAVDLPSGLEATTGEVFDPCVQADITVILGCAKTGLLADAATRYVGRLALVELPEISSRDGDNASIATSQLHRHLLPIRDFDTHKGNYGRIGIIAGSPGYLGAARLCSAAAVHAGGGLVTLYALPETFDKLSLLTIPEVMVKKIDSYTDVIDERNDVLAIGPGLGRDHDLAVRLLVERAACPCVVDADALNAVSTDITLLNHCAAPRLLTPHPGEMERLNPQQRRSRRLWAEQFVGQYPITLLLKGARTLIAGAGVSTSFNPTGNPGMGSGGMGDILTGVTAALMGCGKSPYDAAILGAWLCGRAAEIAIFNGNDSQESLSATAVISRIGSACSSLRNADY